MLGVAQERWVTDGLASSRASWQVLAQQTMIAPLRWQTDDAVTADMDPWAGYPAARDRLLGAIGRSAPNRTVVLTGDIHSSWVNELPSGSSRPNAPIVGAELVATSIASGGDGADRSRSVTDAFLSANPQLKWQNARRGYIACTVTPDTWRAEFRVVPFVTRPDAPLEADS
jgi:alkaline phosphatase D